MRSSSADPRPWQGAAWLGFALTAWLPLLPLLGGLFGAAVLLPFRDARLFGLFTRTLWISGGAALLAGALGLGTAVLATRTDAPLRRVAWVLLPLPLLLPPLVLAQAWYGLTGWTGPVTAMAALGLAHAPLPALLAARSLTRQLASAHEAALLCGPTLALRQMLRGALPATALGALFVFCLTAGDFAVPDYFSVQQPLFHVWGMEVFGHSRSGDSIGGVRAAAPLLALQLAVLLLALRLQRRLGELEVGRGRRPAPLPLRGASRHAAALALTVVLAVLVVAPLGRMLWETGAAGPLAPESWWTRSQDSFGQVFERARGDLLASLGHAGTAALLALLLAPWLAHGLLLLTARRRPALRLAGSALALASALPLLVPSVALGFAAIVLFDRPALRPFYDGPLFGSLLLGGRYLPIAVFLLLERMRTLPRSPEDAAVLCGFPYPRRVVRSRLAAQLGAVLLAAGLVGVFALRELDLKVLVSSLNHSAAVRYFNALHFARDGFVAAFGLVYAALLFLPVLLHQALTDRDRDR